MANMEDGARYAALKLLAEAMALGFKFLAWLNGLGVLLILLSVVGVFELDAYPHWLSFPLAGFLGGLAMAALGLLWSCAVHSSYLGQMAQGRRGRSHWLPLFLTLIAYSLSLVAFIGGCWAFPCLAVLAHF